MRRMSWLAYLGLVVAAFAGGYVAQRVSCPSAGAALPGAAQIISAQAFQVVDENGRLRAVLSVTKDGPGVRLWDENGKVRAMLFVDKNGSGLGLVDENRTARAALYVGKDGPALSLSDANGKPVWSAP